MTTNHDALRDAALQWWEQKRPASWNVQHHIQNPVVNCASPADDKLAAICASLAASKPEPQAQAEPQVVRCNPADYCSARHSQLITLQSHREAMAEAERKAVYWKEEARRYAGNADFWREAIAKKDAALNACVEALKSNPPGANTGTPDEWSAWLAKKTAAITQAQEAMK